MILEREYDRVVAGHEGCFLDGFYDILEIGINIIAVIIQFKFH